MALENENSSNTILINERCSEIVKMKFSSATVQ